MRTDDLTNLSGKQEQAVAALLAQPTIQKAAEAVGVSESTLHRWLGEEAFGRVYRNARREAFAHAISLTQRFAPLAVQTLAQVMADPKAPYGARIAAAAALLKFSRESIELDDLAARVEDLEATMKRDHALLGAA